MKFVCLIQNDPKKHNIDNEIKEFFWNKQYLSVFDFFLKTMREEEGQCNVSETMTKLKYNAWTCLD